MRTAKSLTCVLMMTSLVFVSGCKKKDASGDKAGGDKPAAKKGGATKGDKSDKSDTPKPKAKAATHPELDKLLKKLGAELAGKKCKRDYPPDCPSYKAATDLMKYKKKGKLAFASLAYAIGGSDAKAAAAAGYLTYEGRMYDINRYFYDKVYKAGAKVDAGAAKALIAGLAKLEGYAANRAAELAGWAASTTGQVDALVKVIEGHKKKIVGEIAIKALMHYGRLKAFEHVKKLAKHSYEGFRAAAVAAPNKMPKWTDAEKKAICPWGKGFLAAPELKVASAAAWVMISCKLAGAEYIDALLAEGKKRVDAGQWKRPYDFPFRNVCFGGFMGNAQKPDEKVCNKTYAFLKSVADNGKVPANMRARALDWIYYQRRDKKTYDLMKKYKNHKVKEIATVAKNAMKALKDRIKKK